MKPTELDGLMNGVQLKMVSTGDVLYTMQTEAGELVAGASDGAFVMSVDGGATWVETEFLDAHAAATDWHR
jgi:hypothetical protein